MESNINFQEIQRYSQKYAEVVCNDFFANRDKVNGKELLEMTPVKQVNLFMVRTVFLQWQKEVDKIKSPYFDYDSPEVQKVLGKLMNVLSNHIAISRSDLQPILEKAVTEAILLIFSPYEYYIRQINDAENSRIHLSFLKEMSRYIKVNRHLIDSYVNRLENDGVDVLFTEDAFRVFNEVCESSQGAPEEFEPFLKEFSKSVPLSQESIYYESAESTPEERDEKEREFDDDDEPYVQKSVHEKFAGEKEKPDSINDKLKKSTVSSLKRNISINQRFMFVRELFDNDEEAFDSTINMLDSCQNRQEAINFVRVNCIEGKNWDEGSEEVGEFIEVVERRFPG